MFPLVALLGCAAATVGLLLLIVSLRKAERHERWITWLALLVSGAYVVAQWIVLLSKLVSPMA